MGYRKPDSRRKVKFEDSSNDNDNSEMTQANSKKDEHDLNIALSMYDLGNASRDRNTAHDRENDKQVDFATLNRRRKCNVEGTDEAGKAVLHQDSLVGWANFGGTDSTTNLDDIASGQYHREATAQKVRHEARQLRMAGRDPNAESVDDPSGPPPRRSAAPAVGRGDVRKQLSSVIEQGPRSLDPAIDPQRQYVYRNKTKPSKRGKKTSQSDRLPQGVPPKPNAAMLSKTEGVGIRGVTQSSANQGKESRAKAISTAIAHASSNSSLLTDPLEFMSWADRHLPQPPAPTGKLEAATAVEVGPLTIPGSELAIETPVVDNQNNEDDYTDGRLSPVSMSVTSGPDLSRNAPAKLEALIEHDIAPVHPLSASTIMSGQSLMDDDAPMIPLQPLTPAFLQIPAPIENGHSGQVEGLILDKTPGANVKSSNVVTETKVETQEPSKAVDSASLKAASKTFNPSGDPESPSRVLSIDQRIVDAINPGFRERLSTIDSRTPLPIRNLAQPLHSRPTNVSTSKKEAIPKGTAPQMNTVSISAVDVVQSADTISSSATKSLLGDTSTHYHKLAPPPITSKWGDIAQPSLRKFKKQDTPGPGYEAAYKALQACGKLPDSHQPLARSAATGAGAQATAPASSRSSTSGLFGDRPAFNYEADDGEL